MGLQLRDQLMHARGIGDISIVQVKILSRNVLIVM
jgi:hypothetical protein